MKIILLVLYASGLVDFTVYDNRSICELNATLARDEAGVVTALCVEGKVIDKPS